MLLSIACGLLGKAPTFRGWDFFSRLCWLFFRKEVEECQHPLTLYLVLLELSSLPRNGAQIMVNEPLRRSVSLPGGSEEMLFGGPRIYHFVVFGTSWVLCVGADGRGETQLLAWNLSAVLPGTWRSGLWDNVEDWLRSSEFQFLLKSTDTEWHGFSSAVSSVSVILPQPPVSLYQYLLHVAP